jgi:8-oxo-dGTP pyrophosphatase MutT (NUDIX family)
LEKIFLYSRSGTGGDRRLLDASTVILLRESRCGPYEVFLMRRRRSQAFMGGAHVFPGGRLEQADTDPELASCAGAFCAADARRLIQEKDLPEAMAFGLLVAAIRETFEEAGVFLARDAGGGVVDLSHPETAARFQAYRLGLHEGRIALLELVRREGLLLAPDLLVPYSHWITPEIDPRRFNARFFLARLPEGQIPVHDRMELTDSCWMTPGLALEENAKGRIMLMPPTLKTIEELAAFSNAGQLFDAARSRRISTIHPEAFRTADGFGIRLPHDPEYSLDAHREPPRPGETSRIVMEGGIWRSRSL